MKSAVEAVKVQRFGEQDRSEEDLLAVEEPLEIRLEYGPKSNRKQRSIAVTMRTPGNDLALAAGFLFSEGILKKRDQIHKIDHCANVKKPEEFGNVVKIELLPDIQIDLEKLERNFYMSSSCGVCGKASIEAIGLETCPIVNDDMVFKAEYIQNLPQKAEQQQAVFKHTGGLHAASLFDLEGNLLVQKEDVGRHNALDKVIGTLFLANQIEQLSKSSLLLSGRTGFELVQKAAIAGIPCLASVGAPTSLAVELAKNAGITLIGFLRGQKFNVYAGKVEAS